LGRRTLGRLNAIQLTDDPEWQQHPERYKSYGFDWFQKGWGLGAITGRFAVIKLALPGRNGVVMGADINGGTTPVFLGVDRRTQFSLFLQWSCIGPFGIINYLELQEATSGCSDLKFDSTH
jgi:hypothetical protein